MKTFKTCLAAALLTASVSTYAQTTQTPATQGPAAEAGDMPPSTIAVAPAPAPSAPADASAADARMTPAALAARASTSRAYRMGKGRPAYNNFSRIPGYKDGVTVRDGQVRVTQHGHTQTLTATDTASTFTHLRVQGDGTVQLTDGTAIKLAEGDHVSLTGKLVTQRMQFVQDSTAKAELKDKRKLAARQNRGIRGIIHNSF